jgi:hypothetical protein
MKTQLFGSFELDTGIFITTIWLSVCLAWENFKSKRENGEDQDNPKNLSLDYDGKDTWIKGEVKGDKIYGVKRPDGYYDYEVRYDAGPKDLEYFEAKDRNYLTRILKEGKLFELEPDVWYLREADAARGIDVADIGKWWSQKLKLPNIGELLEKAETLYMYRCLYTFWQEAPKEICQLIAEDFVTGKKLGKLIEEKIIPDEQQQIPMSKI